MRTERRQGLRTNELSQQLDDVREYVRRNATTFAFVVVGAALLVGAGFTYAKWQRDRRIEAWATISRSDPAVSVSKTIEDLEAVASLNLTPQLNVAALLKIADAAMQAATLPEPDANEGGGALSPNTVTDWRTKARGAYTRILQQHARDPIASAQAMIGLGVLAEDEGRPDEARDWYEKIVNDERFAVLPFTAQAKYRLDNLDRWSAWVAFSSPQMTVPIPEGMEVEAFTLPPTPTATPADAIAPEAAPTSPSEARSPAPGVGGAAAPTPAAPGAAAQ